MTLRTRLLAAAVVVTLLLIVVLAGIVVRQRTILTDQIDEQLQTVAGSALRSPLIRLRPPPGIDVEQDDPPTGDLYVAAIDAGGNILAIARPASDPDFAPDPDVLFDLAQRPPDNPDELVPVTVDSVSGEGRARTIVVQIGERRALVVARSTTRIDEAQRQLLFASSIAVLAVVATLGLALWWVDRLGLRPISRLTDAAEDVAAGRSDRRVQHPSTTTETGRLGAAFNTMLDARQEAEDRQRRFVADASHELRTPLTTLRGYADLHASGGLTTPESVDDAMGRIRAEADRMAALVEDLLTLAALDDDRPLDLSPVDLSRLLVDIGSDAAAIQPGRPVDTSGVAPGLVIGADQHLLTQAITAVTSNALRHTPPDAGLTLAAGPSDPGVGDGPITVTVADRGPGIPVEQVPHLFDRFYRADSGRATPAGGRGLGLSIARTVIEAHGGTIAAASTPGRGTTITIELPRSVD